tara:strand:+ start:324 stop:800 length:477 start_codon:yes stop_codon:yes gene_type:complete
MLGMSTLGKIFGTEKALTGIVDGVKNGLDSLVYTEQEKNEAAAKDRAEARGMVVQWMQATQGQNLARRLIALIVTVVWLFMYAVTTALSFAAVWTGKIMTENLQAAAQIIGERAYEMNGAMMLILGFYFAAPHMGDIAKAAIERFGSSRESAGAKRKG